MPFGCRSCSCMLMYGVSRYLLFRCAQALQAPGSAGREWNWHTGLAIVLSCGFLGGAGKFQWVVYWELACSTTLEPMVTKAKMALSLQFLFTQVTTSPSCRGSSLSVWICSRLDWGSLRGVSLLVARLCRITGRGQKLMRGKESLEAGVMQCACVRDVLGSSWSSGK